jgi:hypothetical protein
LEVRPQARIIAFNQGGFGDETASQKNTILTWGFGGEAASQKYIILTRGFQG